MPQPHQDKPRTVSGGRGEFSPELREALTRQAGEISALKQDQALLEGSNRILTDDVKAGVKAADIEKKQRTDLEIKHNATVASLRKLDNSHKGTVQNLDRVHEYKVISGALEEIPANSAMEIVGKHATGEIFLVEKPSADSLSPGLVLFTGPDAIPIASQGTAYSAIDYPQLVIVGAVSGPVVTGDVMGTMADEWFLEIGNAGFVALNDDTGIGEVRADASGGASSAMVAIEITSHLSYNSYLANVYGDGPDAAPTETFVQVKCLQIASTETISNGNRFLATFAVWSTGTYLTFESPRDLE